MEIVKNWISRFWPSGIWFFAGFILIFYIALGFLYFQQGAKQREYEEQIVRLSAILTKPLPSIVEIRAEYDKVNIRLAPKTDREAIKMLVGIAEKSGIDIDESVNKFRVPKAEFGEAKVGGSTYQVLSFSNVRVQGDYDNVMAFLSDLDSGSTLNNMVLRKVAVRDTEVVATGTEAARRAEFRKVQAAVMDMMSADLFRIPNPMEFAGNVATNLMGDDPDTEGIVEGFPDITTAVEDKGYTGTGSPRVGYVLYGHDEILTDNMTQYETVNYIDVLTTEYYYTCEAEGTVRQFDGADVTIATEYFGSGTSKIEIIATVDVDIYTKLE